MKILSTLIEILEISIRRNGDQPLTMSHLLNILKMLYRCHDQHQLDLYRTDEAAYNEFMEETHRYGFGKD